MERTEKLFVKPAKGHDLYDPTGRKIGPEGGWLPRPYAIKRIREGSAEEAKPAPARKSPAPGKAKAADTESKS